MISKEQVENISKLARLKLSEQEQQDIAPQLGNILCYIQKLNEIDTKDLTPTVHAVEVTNVWREDVVKKSNVENVFTNAPGHEQQFFTIPKVLDKE